MNFRTRIFSKHRSLELLTINKVLNFILIWAKIAMGWRLFEIHRISNSTQVVSPKFSQSYDKINPNNIFNFHDNTLMGSVVMEVENKRYDVSGK